MTIFSGTSTIPAASFALSPDTFPVVSMFRKANASSFSVNPRNSAPEYPLTAFWHSAHVAKSPVLCPLRTAYIFFFAIKSSWTNNQYFDSHYFTIFWLILYNLSFYQASYTMEISQKNNVQIHFKIEINLQTWSYLSTSMFLHVFYNSRYFNHYLLLTCSNYIKYCIPLYLNL